jgi:hypothetical protein
MIRLATAPPPAATASSATFREGASSASLGVDTDHPNRAPARYESCGFRLVSTSATYRKPFRGTEETP